MSSEEIRKNDRSNSNPLVLIPKMSIVIKQGTKKNKKNIKKIEVNNAKKKKKLKGEEN